MKNDEIVQIALPYIKKFEGFRSAPYLDSVKVPTIGYGSTYHLDGSRVSMKDAPISEVEGSNLLVSKIKTEYLPGLAKIFNSSDKINSNQYAALLSFAYNLGIAALASSTLARKLNGGDALGAAQQFPLWDKAGGVELAGLKARRLQEQALFNTPI